MAASEELALVFDRAAARGVRFDARSGTIDHGRPTAQVGYRDAIGNRVELERRRDGGWVAAPACRPA